MRTKEEVIVAFSPVAKLDEGTRMRLMKLENSFKELATDIIEYVPDCADRTAAIRQLLQTKFASIQALTHYRPPKLVSEVSPPKEKTNEKAKKKEEAP